MLVMIVPTSAHNLAPAPWRQSVRVGRCGCIDNLQALSPDPHQQRLFHLPRSAIKRIAPLLAGTDFHDGLHLVKVH